MLKGRNGIECVPNIAEDHLINSMMNALLCFSGAAICMWEEPVMYFTETTARGSQVCAPKLKEVRNNDE